MDLVFLVITIGFLIKVLRIQVLHTTTYYHHKDAQAEIELAVGGLFHTSHGPRYGIFVFNDTDDYVSLNCYYGSSQ